MLLILIFVFAALAVAQSNEQAAPTTVKGWVYAVIAGAIIVPIVILATAGTCFVRYQRSRDAERERAAAQGIELQEA